MEEDPPNILEGFTCLFWVVVAIIILLQLACGTQAALPTSEPVSNTLVLYQPTATVTETHVEIETSCNVYPNMSAVIAVKTLGSVNVRECPSTSSRVLAVLSSGVTIDAGAKITTTGTGYNCNRWRPVWYEGRAAWICAEWLSK